MILFPTCSKKPSDVRHKELLEGNMSDGLLELAGKKAGDWARSKPHSSLLLQLATSIPGECMCVFVDSEWMCKYFTCNAVIIALCVHCDALSFECMLLCL